MEEPVVEHERALRRALDDDHLPAGGDRLGVGVEGHPPRVWRLGGPHVIGVEESHELAPGGVDPALRAAATPRGG